MNRTIFILLLLLCAVIPKSSAQIDYEVAYGRQDTMGFAISTTVAENNGEVISAIYWTTDPYSFCNTSDTAACCELIRISPEGEVDLSKTFSRCGDTAYNIYKINNAMQPGYFIGMGLKNVLHNEKVTSYAWVFQFDRNFSILWETIIDTSDYCYSSMLMEYWDSIYFLYTDPREKTPDGKEYYTFYTMDSSGILLLKKRYDVDNYLDVPYIRNIPGTTDFLTTGLTSAVALYRMNKELEILEEIHDIVFGPNPMPWDSDLKYIDSSTFMKFGVGRDEDETGYPLKGIVLRKQRLPKQVLKTVFIRYDSSFQYTLGGALPAHQEALALYPGFLIAGFVNHESHSFFPPNTIYLSAFSHDLDSLWTFSLCQEEYMHELIQIATIGDSACLIVSYRMKAYDDNYVTEAYFARVALPPELITGIRPPDEKTAAAMLYPNPGTDRIAVETSLPEFTVRLYNIHGQLVMEQKNRKELDAGSLPPGIYLYRISAADGTATTGKWVKSR